MNLEESNTFVEEMEKNDRNKKKVLIVMVICLILIGVLLAVIAYLRHQDSLKLKMFIDDSQVAISSNLLMQDNNESYINVKSLASMLGYSYQKGEYKAYTEDANSCYIKNNYEIVSMTADSNTVTKYIINKSVDLEGESATNTSDEEMQNVDAVNQLMANIVVDSADEMEEVFEIESPIKYINDELYVSFNEVERLFNIVLNMSEKNRIRVYSLNYLMQSSLQLATRFGYKEVSNVYENFTAMIDGMLIVGDGTNFGVISTSDGHEIISLKYEKLVYMQNTKEFFATAEGATGIISADGSTIVKPTEYDDISNLDQENKLYLVEKDGKYGVIDGNGETIVYPEYDSIGIQNTDDFEHENIRNFSLLFDKCIPVSSNGKMGIIDINGDEKLKCVNEGLGYVSGVASLTTNSSNKNTNTNTSNTSNNSSSNTSSNNTSNSVSTLNDYDNVLTIPERVGIQGIVVNFDGHYGLYDAKAGRLIIPAVCSKIYSKTKNGNTTYYLEYNEQEIELEAYLEQEGLKSVNSSNQTNDNEENDNENQENSSQDEETDENSNTENNSEEE